MSYRLIVDCLRLLLLSALAVLTACQSTSNLGTSNPSTSNSSNLSLSHPNQNSQDQQMRPSKISNESINQAIEATSPKIIVPSFLLNKFVLDSVTGTDNDDRLNTALKETIVNIDLSNFPSGYAYMGCNHINFAIGLNQNAFKIGNISTTKMLCPSVVSLEMSLAKQVRAVKWYAIESDTLILYGEKVRLHLKPAP